METQWKANLIKHRDRGMLKENRSPEEILTSFSSYLGAKPSKTEFAKLIPLVAAIPRTEGEDDVFWALLTPPEFAPAFFHTPKAPRLFRTTMTIEGSSRAGARG